MVEMSHVFSCSLLVPLTRYSPLAWHARYERYSECYWPGVVQCQLTDDVDMVVCRQQALERLPRKSENEVIQEPAWCIEWYNHYSTSDEGIQATTNEFLQCELTPFHKGFKDLWKKRTHIRTGDQTETGTFFDRGE